MHRYRDTYRDFLSAEVVPADEVTPLVHPSDYPAKHRDLSPFGVSLAWTRDENARRHKWSSLYVGKHRAEVAA